MRKSIIRKSIIRKLATLLIVTLVGTTATFAAADAKASSVPFDVVGTMYEEAVKTLVEKEIITGDTDGLFHPDSNLTRAQACIIVVKSMNPPAAEVIGTATQLVGKSGFKDMSGYGWAEGYIKYAVQHGVTNGYPDGTFKPGNKVTMNELITMVLRAAGFSDASLGGTWPSNYVGKAAELDLYDLIPAPLPELATKWMAAQFTFNTLDKIEAANPPREAPRQGTDKDQPTGIPDAKSMIYANGSFNDTMTTYNGKAISKDAIVYTYGEQKSYSSTMTFSSKISDYRVDTVHKYKNVKTPAFYKLVDGKITEMIIPMDVGFTGRAYGVINSKITTLNGKAESVTALQTLTAAREITWLVNKSLTATLNNIINSGHYLEGEVYEMNLSGGEIKSISKADDVGKKGKVFKELSSTAAMFVEVENFKDGVIKITTAHGGALFEVKNNSAVYVLDVSDPTEYTVGRLSTIKKGVEIRAYDVTDDDESSADIIVVKK